MKDEPWRGDPGARLLHLEKKIHNQKCEVARLKDHFEIATSILHNIRKEIGMGEGSVTEAVAALHARAEKAEAELAVKVKFGRQYCDETDAHLDELWEKLQAAEQRAEAMGERLDWTVLDNAKKAILIVDGESDLAAARERIEELEDTSQFGAAVSEMMSKDQIQKLKDGPTMKLHILVWKDDDDPDYKPTVIEAVDERWLEENSRDGHPALTPEDERGYHVPGARWAVVNIPGDFLDRVWAKQGCEADE